MSSVPDDHQPYHDGVPSPASVPAPTQAAAALALVKRFSPAGWQIENPNGEFWLAIRQRGSEQRVIAAETVLALDRPAADIVAAEGRAGHRRGDRAGAVRQATAHRVAGG